MEDFTSEMNSCNIQAEKEKEVSVRQNFMCLRMRNSKFFRATRIQNSESDMKHGANWNEGALTPVEK